MSTPLECSGPAELDLALDIDHPPGPGPHARGDADGVAEGVPPDLVDGQRVDLAGALAAGI